MQFWADLSIDDVLSRLPRLPRRTIVFLPTLQQDRAGQRFVQPQLAADVAAASAAPVYVASGDFEADGPVGGYVAPIEASAHLAAVHTAALLGGRTPPSIENAPVPNAYVMNARQLRRFGLPFADLPSGTVLRHDEPSIWEEYRWEMVALIGLLTFQAGLIVALVSAVLRIRRSAERRLRETEQHMRMATAATGVGLWMSDGAQGTSWANREHRSMLGLGDDAEPSLAGNLESVLAEDRAHVAEEIEKALARGGDYDVQFRVRPPDGDVAWLLAARAAASISTRAAGRRGAQRRRTTSST